jgi:DegV family protein with EDD domain
MIRIVTDSTCDLPAELVERHGVTVIPISIQFGRETFEEGVTLSRQEFYRKVEALNMIPMTSQPSLGQFHMAYRGPGQRPDTDAILSIHITGHLSGTHNAARLAADQMEEGPPITVFDSLSGSMGLGFMVLEAAQMAETGAGISAILAHLEELRRRMCIFFSLDDLRFAHMSGRVGSVRSMLVSVLQIKPMLTVQEGRLVLVRRVRNRAAALRCLVDSFAESLGSLPARIAVIHAVAPEAAEEVKVAILTRVRATEVYVQDLSIGIAVHFGPGTVGLVGYAL